MHRDRVRARRPRGTDRARTRPACPRRREVDARVVERLRVGDDDLRVLVEQLLARRRCAADSRVSPVSALNAKPNSAMRLPATVLNMFASMLRTNRACCQSFIATTDSQ